MPEARQVVKYTFLKATPSCFEWSEAERAAAAAELAAILEEQGREGTLLAYSTVGLRADCDLLLWHAAQSVDEIQAAESRWRSTRLGPRLEVAHSFLAMTKPSPYLGRHRHPDQDGLRTQLKPTGDRYLFVYPMVKKRAWYRLPYERRKAMMVEHFAIGHRFPQVKINTGYSFGLDDQEFMVAFQCDEPSVFLDLVMELRESQASRYTERETPIFTCVRMAPAAALELALGLSSETKAQAGLGAQISLITGG
jgi:chlorite dismutase